MGLKAARATAGWFEDAAHRESDADYPARESD
jgi:hypothetical protein